MELTQIVLVVVVAILTVILSLVGTEIFFILREFYRAMKKVNKIMDDAVTVSGAVSHQITDLADLISSAKTVVDLARKFLSHKETKEEKSEEGLLLEEKPDNGHPHEEEKTSLGSSVRRFFTRSGKKLS